VAEWPRVGRFLRVAALPIALAGRAVRRYRRVLAGRLQKGLPMSKLALALLLTAALAVPALAQSKEEPKKEPAKKVTIPTNTFFKGQTASQYLAGEQLIGIKVLSQDGQTIGTISDLIVGSGDKIEGVILGVGGFLGVGEKKLGVRLGALRISKADGKIAITFPAATKEMLGAVEAYQRPGGAAPAKK
jgi:PRC-barrel domain protein